MKSCSASSGWALWVVSLVACFGLQGCVTDAPTSISPHDETRKVLILGQVVTVLTGERARKFEPVVDEIELMEPASGHRYNIPVGEANKQFAVFLPPGQYEMTRVKIHEGPFLSIANLTSSFSVPEGPPVFVGTWRFGVESPRYGRLVFLSMVQEEDARQQAEEQVQANYPALAAASLATVLPEPAEIETRLYEVAPYPRIPRYFRRHNW